MRFDIRNLLNKLLRLIRRTGYMWNKIEAFEMWLLRKMMKISYTSHTSNEEVLKMTKSKRFLKADIINRRTQYFGHTSPEKESFSDCYLRERWREKEDGEDLGGHGSTISLKPLESLMFSV